MDNSSNVECEPNSYKKLSSADKTVVYEYDYNCWLYHLITRLNDARVVLDQKSLAYRYDVDVAKNNAVSLVPKGTLHWLLGGQTSSHIVHRRPKSELTFETKAEHNKF